MTIVCAIANLLLNWLHENALIVHKNLSLSYCKFSLIFLETEVTHFSLLSGSDLKIVINCLKRFAKDAAL